VVPKLVKQDEAEKLMRYLDDDEIDIVATDHAPWSTANKFTAEAENPDGLHGEGLAICSGLPSIDHAAAILFYQAHRGFISFERLIDAMSTRPAEILGVKLAENTSATWDMREYRIGEDNVQSQSGWSPYMGKLAIGHVQTFDIGGQRLISAGEIVGRRPEVVTSRGTVI
jgi:dihydroorotase